MLTLRVSQAALVDATLNAASVTTQVTVKDVTPVIDAVNPTLSDVKNATAIETLPVQNRSILNVLAFSPGVVAGGYGGSGGGYTRVNGIPGGSIDYLVDGQTMTNKFTNELQHNPQPTPTFPRSQDCYRQRRRTIRTSRTGRARDQERHQPVPWASV